MEFINYIITLIKPENMLYGKQLLEKTEPNCHDLILIDDASVVNELLLNSLVYDGFLISTDTSLLIDEYLLNEYDCLSLPECNCVIVRKNNNTVFFMTAQERTFSNLTPISLRSIPIDHPQIIYLLAKAFSVSKYLEIGIRDSPVITIMKNIVDELHGVDIKLHDSAKLCTKFHNMTSDDFFKNNIQFNDYFDMIFIDANHDIDFVKRDFDNSFRCVRNHGLIIMHDTYPKSAAYLAQCYCSDSYKIGSYIKSEYSSKGLCSYITLPFHPGLSIARKTIS